MITIERKPARFELVDIPEELGPLEVLVDDHKVKAFAFTQDDYGSWYLRRSPWGRRIGHASILANDLLNVYYSRYEPAIGLHADEELWFNEPVFVGERVTIRGRYVDKYVKRGKGYVVLESEARGEDGRLLARHRGVEVMEITPGTEVGRRSAEIAGPRVTGETQPGRRPVARARAGLPVGTPVRPLTKEIAQDQASVYAYCGIFQRNIHNDLDVARRSGLERTIMQGQQQACYVAELMTSFFGRSWFTTGWLRVKFIVPVSPGQALTIQAAVIGKSPEAGGTRLELETWIRDASGALVTVGWASARVDAAAAGHGKAGG
jgi:acyl dehydratase